MNLPSSTLDCLPRGEPKQLGDDTAVRVQDESTSYMRSDAGFTLIELMVVLLIIAILLAIAIPTFLGVTNTAGDRAAQSNLTNALTEAKALYEVNQAYSTNGAAYTPGQFTTQAPEFNWQTTTCSSTQNNCISYDVVSVSTANDAQGVILAAYSAKTSTCWYVLDLEAVPLPATGQIVTLAGGTTTDKNAMTTAGVYYGKSKTGATTCVASTAATPTTVAGWGDTYTDAGYVY
jgi:type IV pilus assembly protein PilA